MKVKDLIEMLQKLPQDQLVVRRGYEGGYSEVTGASDIALHLNAHTAWYYGKHESVDEGYAGYEDATHAILID